MSYSVLGQKELWLLHHRLCLLEHIWGTVDSSNEYVSPSVINVTSPPGSISTDISKNKLPLYSLIPSTLNLNSKSYPPISISSYVILISHRYGGKHWISLILLEYEEQ